MLADSVRRQLTDPVVEAGWNRNEFGEEPSVDDADATAKPRDTMPSRHFGISHTRGRNPAPRRIYASRESGGHEFQRKGNETLASVLARRGSLAEGSAAITRLLEAGVDLHVKTFNQLMSICVYQVKCGRANLNDAYKVLELARSCGIKPDTILYNGLMSCCAKAALRGEGTVEDGSNILLEMKAAGLRPDIITYNTLMDICAKAAGKRTSGDEIPVTPMTGYSVLKLIEDDGLTPTVVTFTSLMQVFARQTGLAKYW